jgi:hypothetical protein
MADYTVTPSNVIASDKSKRVEGVAGVAITAGQVLYLDPADKTLKLYKANGVAPISTLVGIALHGALVGQPLEYVTVDPAFQPGFTVLAGDSVIGSGVIAGNLCPDADKASGWFVTQIGVGIGSNKIKMQINASGVAR